MVSRKTSKGILLGGFLAMIALSVILGVGAIRINARLSALNADLFRHPFTVSNTLRDIKWNVAMLQSRVRESVLIQPGGDLTLARQAVEAVAVHVGGQFDLIAERYLGDPGDVVAARRAFGDLRAVQDHALDLARTGNWIEALLTVDERGKPLLTTALARIEDLLAFAQNKAEEYRAESERQRQRSRLILLSLIGGVALCSVAIAGFVFYVVRRTERELAAREDALRQAQKMEAVGQLTGGLAHDLNNVLSIISMNSGMLRAMTIDRPKAVRPLELMEKGVERASDLTRKLLDFSRTQPHAVRRVSVNGFVRGVEGLIRKSLTPAIAFEVAVADDVWEVDIDSGDLETALLNLALNARDAMVGGGTLVIETANKRIDDAYVRRNPGSSAGEFVLISVSDTGTGMDAATVAKAFDPFFTTKDVGAGTGLGLSMVYGFVRRSGGHVKIYSESGQGTTVHLYLPRAAGGSGTAEPAHGNAEERPGGSETILVVDDEEDLVDSAVVFLESLGYRTIPATRGKAALEVLCGDATVDLLFSDVVMPEGMDGYQLAIEALKVRPGLRVLLTSGFTRKREEFVNGERRLATDLAKTLLHKPYNLSELAQAIRAALDSPAP